MGFDAVDHAVAPSPGEALTKGFALVQPALFRPFSFGTWFRLGFAAFLANFDALGAQFLQTFGQLAPIAGSSREIWDAPLTTLAVVGAVVLVWGLLLWLGARGEMAFLDDIARGQAEIGRPWREYAAEGNSLFRLRFAMVVVVVVLIGLAVGRFALAMRGSSGFGPGGDELEPVLILLAVIVPLLIGYFVADGIVESLVAPIMYARRIGAFEAVLETARLALRFKGPFALFLLLRFALSIAKTMTETVAMYATLCIGALPYIGTVVMLPIYVIWRGFSAHFVHSLGPDYAIFDCFEDEGADGAEEPDAGVLGQGEAPDGTSSEDPTEPRP